VGMLLTRFGGAENAARTIDLFPDHFDFFYFQDITLIPFSIIPRVIFPCKPTSQTAAFYSQKVAGMIYGGSAAPHPVAEGYLNYGFPGVVILFWIWGVTQALLYRGFYLPRQGNFIIEALYAYYMLEFVSFGGWITGLLAGLPGKFLVLMPLLYISSQKYSKSE